MFPFFERNLSFAMLVAVGCASSGCAEMKERSIRRMEHPIEVVEDKERTTAELRLGAATRHLEKCELEEAGQDIDRTIAYYEKHSWLFDSDYARSLIVRGRVRQLSSDPSAAASDFNAAFFILKRRVHQNFSLMLGVSWRLADCYADLESKPSERAAIENGLHVAAARLRPIAKAQASELDAYSSLLALLERYHSFAEEADLEELDAKFGAQRWAWGEPFDPSSTISALKGEEPPRSYRVGSCVPDANLVAQELNQVFRHCYFDTAAKRAAYPGITRVWANLATDGRIRGVRGISMGVPSECIACITNAIVDIHFKAPTPESRGIELPLVYTLDAR